MLKKLVIDCSTGLQSEVELTPEEIAQAEADAIRYAEEKAIRETAAAAQLAARQAAHDKLAALGLSADEIAAL